MQQLSLISGIEAPTEEELVAHGFRKEFVNYISTTTKINYRFPRMVNGAGTVYIFLAFQTPNRSFQRRWLKSTMAMGQPSDAQRFLGLPENKEWDLVLYPDPQNTNIRNLVPGLTNLMVQGVAIIAPRWCTGALFALEAYVSQGVKALTIVVSDKIPFEGATLVRQDEVLAGNFKIGDAQARALLKMKAVLQAPNAAGQMVETVYDLTGDQIVAIPNFVGNYLRERDLKPSADITHSLIGRPECVDFISEFVVPDSTVVAAPVPQVFGQPPVQTVPIQVQTQVQQPQPTVPVQMQQQQTFPVQTQPQPMVPVQMPPQQTPGFVPFQAQQPAGPGFQAPPGYQGQQTGPGFQGQQTQPGFQPFPGVQGQQPAFTAPTGFVSIPVSTAGYSTQQPTVALTSDMIGRLNTYLLVSRCPKSKGLPRLDTAVQRLSDARVDNYQSKSGKYLNLSTCQYAVAKNFRRQTVGTIPGTNQPFNLAMRHEDLRAIIIGAGKDKMEEQKWDPYIYEVFRRVAEAIIERIGSTTQRAEEALVAVPLNILDTIPTGPSPAGRSVAAAKTPFIEAVPLSGVIEVTVPITDGKRCIPGLMAKKRE